MKAPFLFLGCLLVTTYGLAKPIDGSYWKCTTKDRMNKQWTMQNSYQKMAFNLSFEACKKESASPESCVISSEDCEGFYLGKTTSPHWKCTALDRTAVAWQSNHYRMRDDAALAALAYCKNNSTVPYTCYVNMVTCFNVVDES